MADMTAFGMLTSNDVGIQRTGIKNQLNIFMSLGMGYV